MLVEKPWMVRNKNIFLGVTVASISAVLLTLYSHFLFFARNIWAIYVLVLVGTLAAILSYQTYKSARRFDELIEALKDDIVDAKIRVSPILNFTLECSSMHHGRFSLYYFHGSRYERPYYKLWISTDKPIPVKEKGFRRKLFEFKSRLEGGVDESLADKVSDVELKEIKTLKLLTTEREKGENRIIAIIDDRWLYSETSDIIKSLELLRKIEKML
jgi:hypothetical protein